MLDEVVSIEEVDYEGYVHDIEVEEDHSFVANHIIAHNCLCIAIPVHEQPEDFVKRLKKWKDDPGNDKELEKWYNKIYKS